MLTHHVIKVETNNGFFFTFEKNKENVVVQSCKSAKIKFPRVLEYCNGTKRKRYHSMKEIAEDKNPTRCSILDITKWICEKNQLNIKYHVAEANCQHFASQLWNQFASNNYPIPAEYGKCYADNEGSQGHPFAKNRNTV